MINAAQCRAARALLKWKQRDLADRCEVSVTTIRLFEIETTSPHRTTLKVLKETFEQAGIEFIHDNGIGVTLKA